MAPKSPAAQICETGPVDRTQAGRHPAGLGLPVLPAIRGMKDGAAVTDNPNLGTGGVDGRQLAFRTAGLGLPVAAVIFGMKDDAPFTDGPNL